MRFCSDTFQASPRGGAEYDFDALKKIFALESRRQQYQPALLGVPTSEDGICTAGGKQMLKIIFGGFFFFLVVFFFSFFFFFLVVFTQQYHSALLRVPTSEDGNCTAKLTQSAEAFPGVFLDLHLWFIPAESAQAFPDVILRCQATTARTTRSDLELLFLPALTNKGRWVGEYLEPDRAPSPHRSFPGGLGDVFPVA